MTDQYVRTKIGEALAATGGDRRDAQKLLITWAVRDQSLLLGLTKTHLKAIIASQIDVATRPAKKQEDEEGNVYFTRGEIDKIIASRASNDKRSHKVPPPKSSDRQASVMHQLAEAFISSKSKE